MWIHLQSHFNKLRQGQTGSDQTTVSGISEARQRRNNTGQESGQAATQSEFQGANHKGSSRESTEVNSPGSYTGRSQNIGIPLRMSAGAKQHFAKSV